MSLNPLDSVLDIGGKLLDKFVSDKDLSTRLEHDTEMQTLTAKLRSSLGQMDINKVEAAHKSTFVSGWRPFSGWVCGVGIGTKFILLPIAQTMAVMFMDNPPVFPEFSVAELLTLLLGMLGLSVSRSFEKTKGVSREK